MHSINNHVSSMSLYYFIQTTYGVLHTLLHGNIRQTPSLASGETRMRVNVNALSQARSKCHLDRLRSESHTPQQPAVPATVQSPVMDTLEIYRSFKTDLSAADASLPESVIFSLFERFAALLATVLSCSSRRSPGLRYRHSASATKSLEVLLDDPSNHAALSS